MRMTRRQDAWMLWNSSSWSVSSGEGHKKMKQLFAPWSANTCGQKLKKYEKVANLWRPQLNIVTKKCAPNFAWSWYVQVHCVQFLKFSNIWLYLAKKPCRGFTTTGLKWQSLRKESWMSCEVQFTCCVEPNWNETHRTQPLCRLSQEKTAAEQQFTMAINGLNILLLFEHTFNKLFIFHPFSLAACWFSLAHSCRDVKDDERIVQRSDFSARMVALWLSLRIFWLQFCHCGAGSKWRISGTNLFFVALYEPKNLRLAKESNASMVKHGSL